ncbi:MAG: hypothetical protein C4329_15410, partial [Chitinophagaceae bacterium]
PACNSTYPKGGVSCFAVTFVQAESSVLRMKFSASKSPTSCSCKPLPAILTDLAHRQKLNDRK